jgi:hypothetical protein
LNNSDFLKRNWKTDLAKRIVTENSEHQTWSPTTLLNITEISRAFKFKFSLSSVTFDFTSANAFSKKKGKDG